MEHGCHVAHGAWSENQAAKSSTWRELKAVRMVLESLIPKLKNERIRWFSDNQNVVRIMENPRTAGGGLCNIFNRSPEPYQD